MLRSVHRTKSRGVFGGHGKYEVPGVFFLPGNSVLFSEDLLFVGSRVRMAWMVQELSTRGPTPVDFIFVCLFMILVCDKENDRVRRLDGERKTPFEHGPCERCDIGVHKVFTAHAAQALIDKVQRLTHVLYPDVELSKQSPFIRTDK